MTARDLMSSRCERCSAPSERQQALTAAVVEAARLGLKAWDCGDNEWLIPMEAAMTALRSALFDLDKEGM